MTIRAMVTEDSGGGLTLWIMDNSTCIYAHSGYEYDREPGRLANRDLPELMAHPQDWPLWDGNEIETCDYADMMDDETGCYKTIAEMHDGKITTYPDAMGAAGQREFGIEDQEETNMTSAEFRLLPTGCDTCKRIATMYALDHNGGRLHLCSKCAAELQAEIDSMTRHGKNTMATVMPDLTAHGREIK